jgi:hypothetical protein
LTGVTTLPLTRSCIVLATLAVAAPEASAAIAHPSKVLVASAKPRTLPLILGEVAWYEVTIRNVGTHDEIIDLGYVKVTGFSFIGSHAMGGPVTGTVSDGALPPKCSDIGSFAVIKPGSAVTTLVQLKTPDNMGSLMSVKLRMTFERIMNLVDCEREEIEVSTKRARVTSRPSTAK